MTEEIKARQTRHWNAVAAGWAAWFDWTERNFAPVTTWLRHAALWRPGARVLDVACGAGYPALAAAAAIRPGGAVVATDISPAMVAATSKRATAAGFDNIDVLQMDAEDLRFDPGSFDAVMNAYGLMFCPDPQRAVREAHRVLEPGGRIALVAWDEPWKSPYFTLIHSAAASVLSLSPPDPAAPGPFRLAAAGHLETLLEQAGFADITVESCAATFECESVEEYYRIFRDVAWKTRIAALSEEDAARFRDAISSVVEPYVDQGRLQLVATSLCASARR